MLNGGDGSVGDGGCGGEIGAASLTSVDALAENAQTDAADETDGDGTLVAETRGAEIDPARGGKFHVLSGVQIDASGAEEVLEEAVAAGGFDVGASGDVGGLLHKGRVVVAEHAAVNGNRLALGAKDGVHHGDVVGGVVLGALQAEDSRFDA